MRRSRQQGVSCEEKKRQEGHMERKKQIGEVVAVTLPPPEVVFSLVIRELTSLTSCI